jgi:hypothetical protein
MKAEEEVAQVAGTLARANNSWSREIWVSLVEEEQLNLGVHFIAIVFDTRWHVDYIRLYLNIAKDSVCPISCSTNKLTRDRKITAKLTDCVRQVSL